ncbi:Rossmann-like and DUF2520 domain-containing protein [Microbulbifer hydrolyticus]|uniref:DUF2520 domain-containing protein n=1 Tax=Microbulbifer hydrolyticus TaxID=48074 RepID=A0A6P1TE61_9GAMM|nr:Rossmann-like and DUF2520 domain-containing protein [Microbulbifer hydrolyticus]MBB5209913.1 putative short-subunit dehydrogenase-like oxidoreductase (DUF2520 family) [Microbulbifer hydrolyticus]QHQ39549.1 DUF2520 domain-containing protein [Microbulbifer hydrolyticus]
MHTLNIIGAGNLGRTLARLWRERQVFHIGSICNRSLASAGEAAEFVGAGTATADIASMAPADFWLIAVADDSIEHVAAELAAHLHNVPAEQGTTDARPVVFHCSGALSSSALSACKHASLASTHPVHSFASPLRSLEDLPGSTVALEGDSVARKALGEAFSLLGCSCITLSPEQKVLYHTGSVMACNYLTALMALSLQTFAAAGIDADTARQLLAPIVMQTAKNNLALGPEKALTGPLARGDIRTVTRQLTALSELARAQPESDTPTLAEVYRLLGQAALPLAKKAGLDESTAQQFHTLFNEQKP